MCRRTRHTRRHIEAHNFDLHGQRDFLSALLTSSAIAKLLFSREWQAPLVMPHALPTLDHYATLNLLPPTLRDPQSHSAAAIRQAYRTALLKYHPDKAATHLPTSAAEATPSPAPPKHLSTPPPSIDEISEAYRILSSPAQRRTYDRQLLSSPATKEKSVAGSQCAHRYAATEDGIEVIHFSSLQSDGEGVWWHACGRCADPHGFEIVEENLVDIRAEGAENEVVLGCQGCSMWIRIVSLPLG